MKHKVWFIGLGIVVVVVLVWFLRSGKRNVLSPGGQQNTVALPYTAYTFTNLASTVPISSTIQMGDITATTSAYIVQNFSYKVGGKTVTGQARLPAQAGVPKVVAKNYPTIVMIRGYVDVAQYKPGVGTSPAASYYASHGYLTLAPDFLGYGGSDAPNPDPLGGRLERPVAVLDLLASLPSLPIADATHVYLWGHSNGGEIGLSVLEILGKQWETTSPPYTLRGAVLWAPVSKPFPYDIFAYMDEEDDQGKVLRKEVADFETKYDVFDFSIDKYWNWIQTPIQVEQGMADELVPHWWSDALVSSLKTDGKTVKYFTYPGADHNLEPTGWGLAVAHDVEWFQSLH